MSEPNRASPPAPSEDTAANAKSSTATPSRKRARSSPPKKAKRYVDLGDDAPVMSSWKNDPSYMKLETYFPEDEKAVASIAVSFGMRVLKPVLVHPDFQEGFTFLISDGKDYFMYNEEERRLWKFKNTSLTQRAVVRIVQGETYTGSDFVEVPPIPMFGIK